MIHSANLATDKNLAAAHSHCSLRWLICQDKIPKVGWNEKAFGWITVICTAWELVCLSPAHPKLLAAILQPVVLSLCMKLQLRHFFQHPLLSSHHPSLSHLSPPAMSEKKSSLDIASTPPDHGVGDSEAVIYDKEAENDFEVFKKGVGVDFRTVGWVSSSNSALQTTFLTQWIHR